MVCELPHERAGLLLPSASLGTASPSSSLAVEGCSRQSSGDGNMLHSILLARQLVQLSD